MFELIAKTEINWTKLKGVLPEDVMRNLHIEGRTPLFPFMSLLEEQPFNYALQFVHYTFCFSGSAELMNVLRSRTNLLVLYEAEIGFVSGSLKDWRDFVVVASTHNALFRTRKLANIIYSFFVKEGLETIFKNYSRVELKDQTFYLESKR